MSAKVLFIFMWACGSSNVFADRLDDTFLYRNLTTGSSGVVDPNVLFIFDTSGSMNTDIPVTGQLTTFFDDSGVIGATTYTATGVSINNRQVLGFGPFMVEDGTTITAVATETSGDVHLRIREDLQTGSKNADTDDRNQGGGPPEVTVTVVGDSAVYIAVFTNDASGATFDLAVTYNGSGGTIPTISSDQTCLCESDGGQWQNVNHCSWANAWVNSGTMRLICDEKLDLMKDATDALLTDISAANVGLMRFRTDAEGGYILNAVEDVDEGTNRADMRAVIDNLQATGNTPLAETLYEAYRYYLGDAEFYGYDATYTTDVDNNAFSSGTASEGGVYETPINKQCLSNNIVLLTDGEPTGDSGRDSAISSLSGVTCSHSSTVAADGSSSCLDEMAGYLHDNEQIATIDNSNVSTYTVGFDVDTTLQSFLQVVANDGGGDAYEVDSADTLLSAFESIILSIFDEPTSFVTPAVTVNAFNRLQNRDEVYYAIFEPSADPRWQGNVKKFKITAAGDLLDANGALAVEPSTGFFKETAQSAWAADPDGVEIAFGGIAEKLPVTRNAYTLMTDTPGTGGSTAIALSTSLVDAAVMGVTGSQPTAGEDETYADGLVGWALGAEDYQDPGEYSDGGNHFIGDPLHASPFVVTYGGTEASPVDRLFAMTNLGFLHVVDPADASGVEQWSFIPNDLLPNIRRYADPESSDDGKAYGLDGSIVPWVYDENNDGINTSTSSDFVYLTMGMRRGGTNYYMLDATALSGAPTVMWQINGPDITNDYDYDAGAQVAIDASADAGFRDLGQTWSEPRHTQVYFACTDTDSDGVGDCDDGDVKDVTFFTGGYDPRHDENTISNPSTEITGEPAYGNSVYMVDAETGNLLWSAGNNSDSRNLDSHDLSLAMTHSVPATPGFVDLNGDGLTDIVIAVDITGDVWRIDISNSTTDAGDFATGGKIFSLASSAETGDFLRFFNNPDIVISRPRGESAYMNIVMGSGYRANPKGEDLQDRIYVLHEYDIFGLPLDGSGDPIYTETQGTGLYYFDITDTNAAVDRNGSARDGYYRKLTGVGEKVLQPSVTLNNVALIVTYLPNGPTTVTANCTNASLGSGQVYALDIGTGKSVLSTENILLSFSGIPAAPTIIFVENGSGIVMPVVSFGAEVFGEGDEVSDALGNAEKVYRSYWREN